MEFLDAIVEVIGKRLTRLGISFQPLSPEAARLRVPVGSEAARHLLLEAPPTVLIMSLYEVRDSDQPARVERLAQLKESLQISVPSFLDRHTWYHAFMNRNADAFTVFYAMEGSTTTNMRNLVRALVNSESIGELHALSEVIPLNG